MERKHKIVREAYIYGYPLVTMDMTRQHETNVREPDDAHAPMGQLIKMRAYPAVDNNGAAAPNADTMYTMVWLDVSTEPWVFSIPDMGDRFYIMPMLSGFNEVFLVAGSRATGGKAAEIRHHRSGLVGHGARRADAGQVADRAGVDLRAHLLHRHAGGLPGRPRAAGSVLVRSAQRLRQALHAAARRRGREVRHEEGGPQTGQRPAAGGVLQLLRPAAEDQPAQAGRRADRRADGEDRHRARTGLRPQQAAACWVRSSIRNWRSWKWSRP